MKKSEKNVAVVNKGGPLAFVLFAAYVGALIYFIDKASGFWEVVLAFFQAAVWPAYLINEVFTILQIQ